jgi:hypothetical protein
MVAAQRVRSSRTQPEPRGLDPRRQPHRSQMADGRCGRDRPQAGCVLAIVRTGTGVGDR